MGISSYNSTTAASSGDKVFSVMAFSREPCEFRFSSTKTGDELICVFLFVPLNSPNNPEYHFCLCSEGFLYSVPMVAFVSIRPDSSIFFPMTVNDDFH